MVFRGYIGCCCCCKRESVPFVKSFSLFCMIMSIIKMIKYFANLVLLTEFACVGFILFCLFLINISTLVISSVLRCKANRPNFSTIKKLSITMLVLLSIEFFVTMVGVVVSASVLHKFRSNYPGHDNFGEKNQFEQSGNYRKYDRVQNISFEHRMVNGNLSLVGCALFSFIVFFAFQIWQLYASGVLLKCAKYEINRNNGIEDSDSEESTEEEKPEPRSECRKKKSKNQRKRAQFEDNQKINIVAKKSQNDSDMDYVEFDDSNNFPPSPAPGEQKEKVSKNRTDEISF